MILDYLKLFPSSRRAPAEEIEMAKSYAAFLSDFSIDVIARALTVVGQRGGAFCPSAPEIMAECRTPRGLPRRHILSEPHRVIPPAERERVSKGLAALRDDLARSPGQPRVAGWRSLGDAAMSRLRGYESELIDVSLAPERERK